MNTENCMRSGEPSTKMHMTFSRKLYKIRYSPSDVLIRITFYYTGWSLLDQVTFPPRNALYHYVRFVIVSPEVLCQICLFDVSLLCKMPGEQITDETCDKNRSPAL